MTIKATYYGANGWLIEFDKIRILIDPWLNGDLTFPPGDWLIKGELRKELDPPDNINFLLLTQGQPDHAHPPTLQKINKSISVVASHAASKVVSRLGFKKVTTLKPGDCFTYKSLNIKATSGASVPNLENGYIIDNDLDSIYIEPHGYLDKKIKPRNINVLITPVIDFSLPFAGKFIRGKTVLPELLKLFNPSTVLASTTGGDITFTGVINNLIKVDGSVDDNKIFNDLNTNLINPEPLKQYIFSNS
ncbi:MBL fold metallo-hydrolase [Prochlorococcus marinus]|uniref:MBL fold metallo-hydrolase n=1 Tax=Prochlorococcus marinus XMU1408 TaxID=2213228 RepID=A0A318R4V0_PROMR|nr:MBL fold metallo-hydrolase [Prochlorococcus marinus]MBW3042029.1 MBL fold metallo-hydrolase [Prochlorococcus marinus str. XMU1408]PYE03150.1 MBL fold metallo-hydrolase [Prochlorococcus marinus XMU1408]